MGYENGKIYILKCNDNYFYYGSTTVELKRRFWGHKHSSKIMSSKVYKHINLIGWENVTIELVESFKCNNREELRRKENEFILKEISNKFCLNTLRSYTPLDEKKQQEKERKVRTTIPRKKVVHEYYEKNKNEIKARNKKNYNINKELYIKKFKDYNKKNNERILIQRKIFYNENKDKLLAEKKLIRNTEKYKQYVKEYRNKNKERINELKRQGSAKNKENTG
jgi:predicted GIY-YIG superfamily endonuclease